MARSEDMTIEETAASRAHVHGIVQRGRCLCHGRKGTSNLGKPEGYDGPLRDRPSDLIHRGGDDWQCQHCWGLFVVTSLR